MSKHEDFLTGHRSERGSEQAGGSTPGAPGKRTATEGLAATDPVTANLRTIDAAEAGLEAVAMRYLPAMRAAIDARRIQDARRAGGDLAAALGRIDRQLASVRRWATVAGSAGALELLAPLEAERDARRAEAAPVLALAPPPEAALPVAAAFDFAAMTDTAPAYDEAEAEHQTRWGEQLDAAEAPRDNVIDASDRFGQATVQRRAANGAVTDAAEIQQHAAAGVAGTGTTLPHRDAIQASFGAHDVTGVRAHVGGPAADASAAIGAEAYATGNDVAFAASPSLFVAAHEAAHVVQQRAGVSLLGGVGVAGDAYEQHADAVAETVVRGESAEALLGGPRSAGANAVQRKDRYQAQDESINEARRATPDEQIVGERPVEDESHEQRQAIDRKQIPAEAIRMLTAVAMSARSATSAITKAEGRDRAVEPIVKSRVEAVGDHLRQCVLDSATEFAATERMWLDTAAVELRLLLDKIESVGAQDLDEVRSLRNGIDLLLSFAPKGYRHALPTREEALKRKRSKAPTGSSEQLMGDHLAVATVHLDDAIEQFRQEKLGEAASTKQEGGSARDKEPILAAAVAKVAPLVSYIERCIERDDLSIDVTDPSLMERLDTYFSRAQRFVYWAMFDDPVIEPAQQLADASDALASLVGRPAIVVADPRPKSKEDQSTLATASETLKTGWRRVFEAQEKALNHLSSATDQEAASEPSWDKTLVTTLVASRFSWVVGLVAGGVSQAVESRVKGDDKVYKSAIKTAVSDVTKTIAKQLFDRHIPESLGADDSARTAFFQQQELALVQLKAEQAHYFDTQLLLDAERSPDGRAQIAQLGAAAEMTAAQLAADYTVRAVQDWATYVARARYGAEVPTQGVDLDGVGSVPQDGGLESPDRKRAHGVLELIVELGKPSDPPSIKKAVVGAFRDDDAARLDGQAVRDLTMPLQIRGYPGGYAEITGVLGGLGRGDGASFATPGSLLVSRNHEGSVWLGDASELGRAWLEKMGDGDALEGARRLYDAIAGMTLQNVKGQGA